MFVPQRPRVEPTERRRIERLRRGRRRGRLHCRRKSTVRGTQNELNSSGALIVQFDPECFAYVLDFFRVSQDRFYGTSSTPGLLAAQQSLLDASSPQSHPGQIDFGSPSQNPLLTKQAIIVLREELEYFVIPPDDNGRSGAATDEHGIANQVLLDMKKESGAQLLEKKHIFTALQVRGGRTALVERRLNTFGL